MISAARIKKAASVLEAELGLGSTRALELAEKILLQTTTADYSLDQLTPKVLARYWAKVERRGPDECWPWLGASKTQSGYGQFFIADGRKHVRASRLAWEIANHDKFPAGMYACHTCDNPNCVNPAHIWPGTASENQRDSVEKGRATTAIKHMAKTHCPKGHEYTLDNLVQFRFKKGQRQCKTCLNAAQRRYDRARRAA